MPNKFKSYAYRIENAEAEGVKEFLEDVEGVYDGQEGGKIIYSRARLGKANQAVSVNIRVVEQRQNNVATGRFFINLVDNSLEQLAELGAMYQQAEAFGSGFASAFANHAVAKLFSGSATPVAAPAIAAPVETKAEVIDHNVELNANVQA